MFASPMCIKFEIFHLIPDVVEVPDVVEILTIESLTLGLRL